MDNALLMIERSGPGLSLSKYSRIVGRQIVMVCTSPEPLSHEYVEALRVNPNSVLPVDAGDGECGVCL